MLAAPLYPGAEDLYAFKLQAQLLWLCCWLPAADVHAPGATGDSLVSLWLASCVFQGLEMFSINKRHLQPALHQSHFSYALVASVPNTLLPHILLLALLPLQVKRWQPPTLLLCSPCHQRQRSCGADWVAWVVLGRWACTAWQRWQQVSLRLGPTAHLVSSIKEAAGSLLFALLAGTHWQKQPQSGIWECCLARGAGPAQPGPSSSRWGHKTLLWVSVLCCCP